jgi:uncharacterized protein YndB with AHSA1/START domain
MKFVMSVDIGAAPEAVFPWIGDPERGKQWSASVVGGEIIRQTPGWVGTTFREQVGREGRTLEMQGVITEYAPNERFAVHLESSRHTADVRFVLEPVHNVTRLSREVDLRLKGVMKYCTLFLRTMLRKSISKEGQEEFAELKRLCEGGKKLGKG